MKAIFEVSVERKIWYHTMMRFFLIFGAIGLFVFVSFIPPSGVPPVQSLIQRTGNMSIHLSVQVDEEDNHDVEKEEDKEDNINEETASERENNISSL